MPKKMLKSSDMRFTRSFKPKTFDDENRTVELEFSSETEVKRWYGMEVLDHRTSSVDMTRLATGRAPLMLNHWEEQIGVVEKAEIKDKRGVATVRFSKVGKGAEIYENVKDGIMTNVSVGYRVMKYEVDKSNAEKTINRATSWQPYEISIVSIPADHTVGVRSDDNEEVEVEFIDIHNNRGDEAMPQPVQPTPTEPNVNDAQTRSITPQPNADEVIRSERTRIAEIDTLCTRHKIPDEKRKKWISDGNSLDQVRGLILESLETPKETMIDTMRSMNGPIGEVARISSEPQEYSFARAINALATGKWDNAGYEREVSEELTRSMPKKPEGLYMPLQTAQNRALTTQTGETGGYLVGQQHRPQDFIDLLRNKTKTIELGARLLDGLQGDVVIPKMTNGTVASWVNETEEKAESNQNFGQIKMSPKTLATHCQFSRQMVAQSSPAVEQLIRDDMALASAIAIDKAVLSGAGTNGEPTGIMNIAGVGTVTISAGNPSFANIIALETDVATANADIGNLAYLASVADRGVLKAKEKASNTAQFIWNDKNQVNGYRAEATNQLSADQIIFGNWGDILIGQWLAMDVIIDPYTLASKGLIRVIAHQMADIAIRNAGSFSYTVTS